VASQISVDVCAFGIIAPPELHVTYRSITVVHTPVKRAPRAYSSQSGKHHFFHSFSSSESA
jgi:hypothetical protein